MGLFEQHASPPGFNLLLDDFSAEYAQSPRLDYPADKLSRLATGLGWKAPAYKIDDQSMSPRAWKSKIKVLNGSFSVFEKIVDVNYPLRYGGYTFYQDNFEQTLKIRVNDSFIPLETKADEDLFLPGLDAPVSLGAAKDGVLYRIDGGVENIRPATVLKRQVKADSGEKKYEEVGRVELGDSILLDGRKITLAGVADSSTLSYRYDPGAKVLWWAGILVIAAMSVRFFGGWYLIAYKLDEKDRIVSLDLHISTRGLGANGLRLAKRLESALTRNDIRPASLPPSF
jgi:cytochrome c biogenesis protein ResB